MTRVLVSQFENLPQAWHRKQPLEYRLGQRFWSPAGRDAGS